MRLKLLTSNYPPTVGGISTHVEELSRHLGKEHDMEVVCFGTKEPESWENVETKFFSTELSDRRLRPFKLLLNGFKVWNQFRKEEIDILHLHDTKSAYYVFVARLLGLKTPVVFTNHTSGFMKVYRDASLYDKFKLWMWGSVADVGIAPSRDRAKAFDKVTSSECYYIPNGVDTEKFKPSQPNNEENIILTVSHLRQIKGLDTLIDALAEIETEYKWLCVGEGPYRGGLEEKAERNEINVEFVGRVNHDKVHNYYQRADIFCMPSKDEATSISALEALSSGLPIIASDIEGLREIVDNGVNGFTFELGNSKALKESLEKILEGGELRKNISDNNREKALSEFSWEKITQKTEEVYEKIIKDRN
jgi:glycosyltransferase involved in cell wall biosynthesis